MVLHNSLKMITMAILFKNNDEESMVNAILEVVSDDKKAIKLGENGRNLVLDEFKPSNIVEKWNDLFEEKLREMEK